MKILESNRVNVLYKRHDVLYTHIHRLIHSYPLFCCLRLIVNGLIRNMTYDADIMTGFNVVSKNGVIVPASEAVMPVSSIELVYGFGVYESIRVSKGVIYFLDNHIDRLLRSADIITLEHIFSHETIKRFIKELVDTIDSQAFNIKILLYGAKEAEEAQLFIIPLSPLFPDKSLYKHGARLITVQYERLFPNAKTLSMLGSYLAYKKAKESGCYDALLVGKNGVIPEGTRTNFYGIKDDIIYTSPNSDVLEGVTREILLRVARETGIKVKFKPIFKNSLKDYNAFFITSTSSKLMPVRMIDSLEFEIPVLLKRLMKDFNLFLLNSNGVL